MISALTCIYTWISFKISTIDCFTLLLLTRESVRMLLNEWVKDNKNNELNLNMSDILNFVRKSVYVVWKN